MPDGAAQDCPGLLRAEVDRLRAEVASAHTKIENLEIALRSSRQIGAAVGVLMHQHRLTQNAAFDLLVAASQYSHRKLRDIAADVVYTGTSASVEAAARRNRSAVDLRGAIEVDHVRHLRHDD